MNGGYYNSELLTDRESEVLLLLSQGANNQQIAHRLNITLRTVKFHTTNIYNKIGCNSRYEAIVWALSNRQKTVPVKNS